MDLSTGVRTIYDVFLNYLQRNIVSIFLPQLCLEREAVGRKEIINLIFKEMKQYWLGFSPLKAPDLSIPLNFVFHINKKLNV